MFGRKQSSTEAETQEGVLEQDIGLSDSQEQQGEKPAHHIPRLGYNHNGHKIVRGIHPDGESGRSWVHPWHFLRICGRSSSTASLVVNFLWPFVPAAIVIHFVSPNSDNPTLHLWRFILNYIAMVPSANLIGFSGQELARKLPKVYGMPSSPANIGTRTVPCSCPPS